MVELKEKRERLKIVLSKIDAGKKDERFFRELNSLREEEYELEGGKQHLML